MRKLVVVLVVVLGGSGLLLVSTRGLLPPLPTQVASLAHTWGGLLFLVVYPLYAWDHILANRRWLRALRLVMVSGVVQALSAVLLILTGLVVLAYGEQVWTWARTSHHWLTYPLSAALLAHWLAPKRWKTPSRDRQRAEAARGQQR